MSSPVDVLGHAAASTSTGASVVYPLPFLLGALILALLCNCDTLEAVGQWCTEHRDLLAAQFPGQRFHTPTGSLYRRLLPHLSVVHVEAALALWVRGSLVAAAEGA